MIQFLAPTEEDDGLQRKQKFAPVGDPVWAKKADVSDGEKWRAGQHQAWRMSRFVVRHGDFVATITPQHRLQHDGQEYEIIGIKEVGGRRRALEITAVVKVA